ncbi:MAG: hypothetical protein ACI4QL_03050, partial [Candidatus Fimimonas sp.]
QISSSGNIIYASKQKTLYTLSRKPDIQGQKKEHTKQEDNVTKQQGEPALRPISSYKSIKNNIKTA